VTYDNLWINARLVNSAIIRKTTVLGVSKFNKTNHPALLQDNLGLGKHPTCKSWPWTWPGMAASRLSTRASEKIVTAWISQPWKTPWATAGSHILWLAKPQSTGLCRPRQATFHLWNHPHPLGATVLEYVVGAGWRGGGYLH
jgi:hypothetical protein